jgi:hypothetical protein
MILVLIRRYSFKGLFFLLLLWYKKISFEAAFI